jgi:hypothetical protein
MSDDPTSTYVSEQNRRKLEEQLKKVREHGGKVPKVDPVEARRIHLEKEAERFQRDWQAWKKVYQGRIIDLSAQPRQDDSADRRLLGVAKDAGKDEIRKAFYALAKKNHPDTGGDPDQFRALMDAYRSLTGDA